MAADDRARRGARRLLAVGVVAVALAHASGLPASPEPRPTDRLRLAVAAEAQVGVTLVYDPTYVPLAYPGGDVPRDRGVCADVIVRAFREIGVDLQVALHEDMLRHFAAYPRIWGLHAPDPNIDHRRVPNLMTYFRRQGRELASDAAFEPGDVVAWRLPSGLHHIGMVVRGHVAGGSEPFVVHNIGQGARREDVLHTFEIIGHYRW